MYEFVEAVETHVRLLYPSIKDNPDYTSVINQHHVERLQAVVAQAREIGAEVREIVPESEDLSAAPCSKIPPTLVIEPDDGLQLMQEEVFGPILPIKGYREVDDVIAYVND
jgi:coniferyl-aldehyde dehydrogenase